jgi:hypothetical protein
MALRLQSDFFSEKGHKYTVSIYDSDYSGSTLGFNAATVQINYDFDGNENDRFAPILSSGAVVSIVINSESLNTFITDLVGAAEDRFYMLIEDDASPVKLRWVGYILPDLVVEEDIEIGIGYIFDLKAKDGFNYLKNIDYKDVAGEYTGYATLKEHILNALDKLPFLDELYGSTNIYIKFLMSWYESNMSIGIGGYNQLNHLRIHHRAFKWKDSKGNVHFRSCYDVLKYIAITFGARWMFSGRYIYFIQVNEYATAEASKVWWNLRNDSFASIDIGSNPLVIENNQAAAPNSDIFRLRGGAFKYLPALKEVLVEYEHIATRNLVPGAVFNDQEEPTSQRIVIEDVDTLTVGSFLALQFTLNYTSSFFDPGRFEKHYLVFGVKIIDAGGTPSDYPTRNDGTYKRDVTFNGNGYEYGKPEWTTATDQYYKIVVPVNHDAQKNVITTDFNVYDLPSGTYGFGVEFYLLDLYTQEDGIELGIAKSDITWNVDRIFVEAIALGFFSEQNDILEYGADNDAFTSQKYKVRTVLGDGPNLNSPGRIDVYDGSEWVQSTSAFNLNWASPNFSLKNISQLLADEIISSQLSPIKYFADMDFVMSDASDKFLFPHYAIKYDGAYWVFQGGSIDLMKDQFSGNWWKMNFES